MLGRSRVRRGALAAAVVGVWFAAGPSMVAAAAGSTASPALRVDVSSDVRTAKTGDVVTFTVHVRNLSKSPYSRLRVAHKLPAGFKMVSTTPRAAKSSSGPEWTVDLAAGQSVTLSDTAKAGSVADAEHLSPKTRTAGTAAPTLATFTTTACALDGATHATLACGDARQSLTDAAPGAKGGWRPGLVGLGFLAVAIGTVRNRVRRYQQWQGKA